MSNSNNESFSGITLDRMIQPTLLLLIFQKSSHGYELIQNFNALNKLEAIEPGTIYRNLRRMEKDGFVISKWETSESGPARRKYEITSNGIKALNEAALKLDEQRKQLEIFLEQYNSCAGKGGKE